MLKSIDYSGNQGSIFICDKCGKEICVNKNYKFKISVQGFFKTNRPNNIKKIDLCKDCYTDLCNYIKKRG